MVKMTTRADKIIGVLFAMAISSTCFAFAAIEEGTLKSLCILSLAVFGITILPIVFLWPRSERTSGSRSSGMLKLNISKVERYSVFKVSLSLSLAVLCAYLFVWLYLRGCDIGLVLVIVLILALACCLISVFVFSAKVVPVVEERSTDQLSTAKQKKAPFSDVPELRMLKKWRWLVYIAVISVLVRIGVMCVLYGIPSFCPNCILYWGKHNFNGSGMHLPEHSLFTL